MGTLVGYIGVVILFIGYTTLLTKYKDWFFGINTVASFLLSIHAFILNDIVFLIVNGWITLVMAWKTFGPMLEKISSMVN